MTEPNQHSDEHQDYQQDQGSGYGPPDKPREPDKPQYPPPDQEKPEYPPRDDKPEYPPKGEDEPKYPPKDEPKYPPKDEPKYPPKDEPKYPPKDEPEHPPKECEGYCHCPPCPTGFLPKEGALRRLLQALEDKLQEERYRNPPLEAVNKFKEALQACDQEYKGFTALVKKYREYHCKIDCELDKAESWCNDIKAWCESLDVGKRAKIKEVWETFYEKKENELECDSLKCRDHLKRRENCLKQAEIEEQEAKEDFESVKNFEQTLKDRFADLKSLYDRAKGHLDAGEYGAVCAVGHEFRKVYQRLAVVKLWEDRRRRCEEGPDAYEDCCDRPDLDTIDFCWFKRRLIATLRALILAKYQYFCRYDDQLRKQKSCDDKKTDWEDFKASRRDRFVGESQENAEEENGEQSAA